MDLEQVVKAVGDALTAKLAAVRKAMTHLGDQLKSATARIDALEARPAPERGEKGEPGQQGLPGRDGRDATDEQIAKAAAAFLTANPPARGEKGDAGRDGADGRDGRDAEPINLKDVAAELLEHPGLKALVDLLVTEAVAKHMAANPVRDGRDGRDGKDGQKGEQGVPGEKGEPGRDGLDVGDMFRNADGHLIAVMSNGTTRDLGIFVGKDGCNGKDGRDGLSVENLTRTYIPETHEIIERWSAGGVEKELRYPAGGIRGRGYWREGVRAAAGEAYTDGGQLWIAKCETSARPSHSAPDWFLAAAKGRDGPRGEPGKDYVPPAPVKLKE